jgi:hypothetical protein
VEPAQPRIRRGQPLEQRRRPVGGAVLREQHLVVQPGGRRVPAVRSASAEGRMRSSL